MAPVVVVKPRIVLKVLVVAQLLQTNVAGAVIVTGCSAAIPLPVLALEVPVVAKVGVAVDEDEGEVMAMLTEVNDVLVAGMEMTVVLVLPPPRVTVDVLLVAGIEMTVVTVLEVTGTEIEVVIEDIVPEVVVVAERVVVEPYPTVTVWV